MPTDQRIPSSETEALDRHLANIAANLQLVADLGYGDVALCVLTEVATLRVVADARPMTALAAVAATRVGVTLRHDNEPEAYAALSTGEPVAGDRRRTTRGISYVTFAYPVGPSDAPYGVIVRDLAAPALEAPGKMERAFMRTAEEILALLSTGPILDIDSGEPYATLRHAGDGLARVDAEGSVTYASPNIVNIMRLAGVEGRITDSRAEALPGSAIAILPLLGTRSARSTEVEAGGRVLTYRVIGLAGDALVLVEDVTEVRRRELELKVKEATIREVHHRVKNNLQTIASLLRIQARRVATDDARRALAEATERVGSMAIVHEMLAGSTEERIEFTDAARTVVQMVHRGLAGDNPDVNVEVTGSSGLVPAQVATSLALVIAELTHNAIEHGLA
ncbi:hypothetical protein EG835_09305, partial [bacterium]|nr:hypothetical protein [bacterium]